MINAFRECLEEKRQDVFLLLRRYLGLGKPFLLRSDLLDEFRAVCEASEDDSLSSSSLGRIIRWSQEATVSAPWVAFALRPRIGEWQFVRIHEDALEVEPLEVRHYLQFKERIVSGQDTDHRWKLEIDLGPFNREFPRMTETRSIGRGVEFLNRHLANRLFVDLEKGDERLLRFLQVHQHQNVQLMLNRRIQNLGSLRGALRRGLETLSRHDEETPWSAVQLELQELGFEPGWGGDVQRVAESFHLLSEILEAPDPGALGRFLGRLPMIFDIVVLSPHGFFGQDKVLGLPDTGGQIVYILNQVRALEDELHRRMQELGLDMTPQILVVTRLIPEARGTCCDQRLEPIAGTRNARILRVPFRNSAGEIVPQWTSRFEIWPYLERFALEAEPEILAELGGRPDLCVGNYSDGNLVASLLAASLRVTQCNIAHALEKSKYLLSDLYWKDLEEQYNFSCQFTADLISMNTADFIIASTYQEIAGTKETIGQYESYGRFTMPGLCRVVNGIDVFDPKFNIVSPGASPDLFFPYTDRERRMRGLLPELEDLVYGDHVPGKTRGVLADSSKPLLFSMSRMDRVKNLTGLVDWYGRCPRLREVCNLLISGGLIDPDRSPDAEERDQIRLMHELMDRHQLDDRVRWLGMQHEQAVVGEFNRFIADRRGAFVQPALFEAFGLTVVESLISGLPTFATCYGGPLEIIEHGRSGFHIDPNHGDQAAELMADFFERCREDPSVWDGISEGGIRRAREKYTWSLYAERVVTLSCIYGFWKYVTNLERSETRCHLDLLYGLQFLPLAEKLDS